MRDNRNPPLSLRKFTLVFVKNESSILFGLKKRGFGVGKWNGFGGKVEEGESVVNCAVRELKEESNLMVSEDHLKYLGYVLYRRVHEGESHLVHIFMTDVFLGSLMESEEMKPKWFKFEEIPYDNMWPDSKYWLPNVLKGRFFRAEFSYGDADRILEKLVDELNYVPQFYDL